MDDFLQQVNVLPGTAGNAVPVGGWDAIADFIAQHYSGLNDNQRIHVLFKVNDGGVPIEIRPQVSSSEEIYEQIIKILQAGPKWEGEKGDIEIIFPE